MGEQTVGEMTVNRCHRSNCTRRLESLHSTALTTALLLLNIRWENSAIVLKPEQEKTINNLVNGRDVMAILPTGVGKSMIYTIFALAKEISLLKTCDCHCPFEKYYRRPDFRNVVAKLHGNGTYDGSTECGSRESTSISPLLR